MGSLAITFCVTAIASLALTGVVRSLARRLGVIDHPDGKRKLHKRLVPRWGGVAVYLSLCIGLLAARHGTFGVGSALDEFSIALAIAAGFVCLSGAIDDRWPLNPRLKLALQTISVAPLVLMGYWFDWTVVFGVKLQLGYLGIPLTILWLVGCINALNLLDGMDGLASLVGLATAGMLAVIAVNEGHPHVSAIAVVMIGALAGFLFFNLPPATIFLGDSGSMVIGLVLGALGVQGSLKTSTTLAITAPAVIMALPMLDIALAVVRRKLTGRRFDSADRQHIHHRLLDRGLTPWQVLCVVGAICLALGGAATAATIFRNDAFAWVTAITLLVLAIRLRWFGHYELSLVTRLAARGLVAVAQRLYLTESNTEPPVAEQLEKLEFAEAWQQLIASAATWKVRRLELSVQDISSRRIREKTWNGEGPGPIAARSWSVVVHFRQCNGATCTLTAILADQAQSDLLSYSGLLPMLQAFGARFAADLASVPAIEMPPREKAVPRPARAA